MAAVNQLVYWFLQPRMQLHHVLLGFRLVLREHLLVERVDLLPGLLVEVQILQEVSILLVIPL